MPFPVDARYVERAELQLGLQFPADYRQRIVRNNGGEVVVGDSADDVWLLFPIKDDSDMTRFKRSWDDVVRHTERERLRPDYPEGSIAIGEDGCGNLLLLLLLPCDDQWQVATWDHETGDTCLAPSCTFAN